jgi:hypothetical protein
MNYASRADFADLGDSTRVARETGRGNVDLEDR